MTQVDANLIVEALREMNPEALLADGLNSALIGITSGGPRPPVAVYDYDLCVDAVMARDDCTEDEAVEHVEHNVVSANMGDHTPVFIETGYFFVTQE